MLAPLRELRQEQLRERENWGIYLFSQFMPRLGPRQLIKSILTCCHWCPKKFTIIRGGNHACHHCQWYEVNMQLLEQLQVKHQAQFGGRATGVVALGAKVPPHSPRLPPHHALTGAQCEEGASPRGPPSRVYSGLP